MQRQTLKSIQIGEVTVSETAEGNTVNLGIEGKSATLTREDFTKLEAAKNELFTKDVVVKCSVCGHEMECSLEMSESTALVAVPPCQNCFGKEPIRHENS